MAAYRITQRELETLKARQEVLTGKRREEIMETLSSCKISGDDNNVMSQELYDKQRRVGTIDFLLSCVNEVVANCEVINEEVISTDRVAPGLIVGLYDDEAMVKYYLLSEFPVEIEDEELLAAGVEKAAMSTSAPVGQAIMGKKVEDIISVQTRKTIMYRIEEIYTISEFINRNQQKESRQR